MKNIETNRKEQAVDGRQASEEQEAERITVADHIQYVYMRRKIVRIP